MINVEEIIINPGRLSLVICISKQEKRVSVFETIFYEFHI